jgi:hypothetical protein
MEALLAAIEASPPAAALRVSFYAYPLVNAAHVLAVGGLVTTVILLDLRLLGAFAAVDRASFATLMRRVALALFAAAVLTGLALFSVQARDYAANPAFLLKLGLIVAALANFLLLAPPADAGAVSTRGRVGAALSLTLWPCVLAAGRFIGFV